MPKFAVVLYPDFSLQEITCLTSVLTVWFDEKIDYIASSRETLFSAAVPSAFTSVPLDSDAVLSAFASAPWSPSCSSERVSCFPAF